ncbi:MAG: VanZ family protein [Planctomycetaceae bacterium]
MIRTISLARRAFAGLLLLAIAGCVPADDVVETRFVREIEWVEKGQWLKVDLHNHTEHGDGGRSVEELVVKAAQYGCDAIAITDNADQSLNTLHSVHWESVVQARESHPGILIIGGLEWNLPPYGREERAIVLMPDEELEYAALSGLKERYDDEGMSVHDPARAKEALEWLAGAENPFRTPPVLIYSAPSRNANAADDVVNRMEDWRSVNDLFVGLAGAPGHQAAVDVGEYTGTLKTIDRWDPAVAEVGGAWDQLLQRNIDAWGAFASSNFHRDTATEKGHDYWPGQFSETWVYAPDRSIQGILKAVKAGSFFGVHGKIARQVELTVTHPGLPRRAFAGEAIEVTPGSQVMVSLNGLIPDKDWAGYPNRLDSIELIISSPEGIQHLTEKVASPSVFILQKSIPVPAGGCTIRARGRRVDPDGDDLMFYTNPVRITVRHSHVPLDDAGPTNKTTTSGQQWYALTIIAGLIASSAGALWLFNALIGSLTPAKIKAESQTAGAQRRWYLQGGTLWFVLMFYSTLVPFAFQIRSGNDVMLELQRIQLYWPAAADRTILWTHGWMSALLMFLWLGGLIAGTSRKGLRLATAAGMLTLTLCAVGAWEIASAALNGREVSHVALIADAMGCAVGLIAWLLGGEALHRRLGSYTGVCPQKLQTNWLLTAYIAGLAICAVLPFDLLLTPQDVYQKFEGKRVLVSPFSKDSLPVQSLAVAVMAFIPVGVGMSRIGAQTVGALRPILPSAALGIMFAFAVEFGRLLAFSRVADSTHIFMHVIGVVIGALAIRFPGSDEHKLLSYYVDKYQLGHYLKWNLAAVTYVMWLCFLYWWPFAVLGNNTAISLRSEQMIHWPFQVWMHASEPNPIAKLMTFVPFGMLLAQIIGSSAIPVSMRKKLTRGALGICLLLALGIETVQIFFPPNIPDVSDVVAYTAGAWLGMLVIFKWLRSSP